MTQGMEGHPSEPRPCQGRIERNAQQPIPADRFTFERREHEVLFGLRASRLPTLQVRNQKCRNRYRTTARLGLRGEVSRAGCFAFEPRPREAAANHHLARSFLWQFKIGPTHAQKLALACSG